MKRLLMKKLIVISIAESKSLEIPFSAGLNIILGENKTGKSSIIKSIFTAFGCQCKKNEADWKKLISTYIVYFQYGEEDYCIKREKDLFQIFCINDEINCIIETDKFTEYSNCLMKIFEVNMPCISKDGKEFNITPPLLFRLQYIDQDVGWNDIGTAFNNVSYIKDWKSNTNKYICGYLDERYFKVKAEKQQMQIDQQERNSELSHNKSFVTKMESHMSFIKDIETESNSIDDIEKSLIEFINLYDVLKKEEYMLVENIHSLENELFIFKNNLALTRNSLEESQKDIEFALVEKSELACPLCGITVENNLKNQLLICEDTALAEKIIIDLSSKINSLDQKLELLKNREKDIKQETMYLKKSIEKSEKLLSYKEYYHNEGIQEFYNVCLENLKKLEDEIDLENGNIAKKDEKLKILTSRKRANEIKLDIMEYCNEVADILNVSKNDIKLRDFVQTLNHTGSENPRIIYMYQAALYLYNLYRKESPFNFFVVDTPNQQGQDAKNLKNIDDSLALFISLKGQVILGTERKTGYEEKASIVFELKEKKRCLNTKHYEEHIKLLAELNQKANQCNNRIFKKENKS
ncbi:hypothetical protein ACFLKB_13385 [Clostridium sp. FAM 1755]|uniref:hypothetical protein n=1 Tax=Clostridium caseinilyticum TaxID=3350403 RepID=UPI0038F66EB3